MLDFLFNILYKIDVVFRKCFCERKEKKIENCFIEFFEGEKKRYPKIWRKNS